MVNFTIDLIREIMDSPHKIRNISVIAHVDHGKSTLTDSLVAAAGIISQSRAGETRYTDTIKEEQERGITIKSTALSLFYHVTENILSEATDCLVNLIDCPGHVDFSSEVTSALRVTDGAMVVVDCVEGVCVQTETVLRQALAERIKPVLMVNKLDRAILELSLDPEEAYQSFNQTISSVNVVVATYNDEALGDVQCYPEKGTVAFGSGYFGWAFTLGKFARMYNQKFGVQEDKLMSKLWGDNFYDSKAKKWYKSPFSESGEKLKRAFSQFIWEPIQQMFDAVMNSKREKYEKMITGLGITLNPEERELEGKKLLKAIMQKWLPASDALLGMIVVHLPSPIIAQAYRAETLYTGPTNDRYFNSIRCCDPKGPMMMYVSKMVPSPDKGRFIAFGRVFSGSVRSGQKTRIMGPFYEMGEKTDLSFKKIQRTVLMMGRYQESVEDVPAGNLVGLIGVDQSIVKTATIADEDARDVYPLKDMKYSVSPVVRVAVEPKNMVDLPKLIEALKKLSKADSLVQCITEDTGEHIVAGAGELHLEVCLKNLQEDYMGGCELKISEPVVTFRETVSIMTPETTLTKTGNKLNRIFGKCQPLSMECCDDIESGKIGPRDDPKARSKVLSEQHGWDAMDTKKIWCFGPDDKGANIIVDQTKGVNNISQVKDHFISSWQWATKEGVVCGENMRGVRYDLQDLMLHSDTAHCGAGQMSPAARSNFLGCELSSAPRLLEPMFLVEIQTTQEALGGVYSVLHRRRGSVVGEENRPGTPIYNIKAYLPVQESFGFTADLRASTSGQAFPQCVFDHWELFNGDPLDPRSPPGQVVYNIRKRKGLKEQIPSLDNFVDKL
eukprot:NODE_432_length_2764_cov_135.268838_g370_i1.p1 GENE.NODE_432_length_2764_cov_135.268838_g370_i1~~NODE_432_length_2764_cov_135.268838_g370_i1.p1  ORF type:complete len:840 (-),score=158.19 NODE_432_length_2764_cov_135.268838_g370_i1:175-2694(-)